MLNPEFRWLDPEAESLERLGSLAGPYSNFITWEALFQDLDQETMECIANQASQALASPGVHSRARVMAALRHAAQNNGIMLPECGYWGWSESSLARVCGPWHDPVLLTLGVLTAEGIWTGGFAGISRQGLDFISSFRYLWQDLPELASKQELDDLAAYCQALEKRFSRPGRGLFLYKDEFLAWRDQQWSGELLENFLNHHTAVKYGW